MAISLTKFEPNDHTMTVNLGTVEVRLRHLSDDQIVAIRSAFPTLENGIDATNETIAETS